MEIKIKNVIFVDKKGYEQRRKRTIEAVESKVKEAANRLPTAEQIEQAEEVWRKFEELCEKSQKFCNEINNLFEKIYGYKPGGHD